MVAGIVNMKRYLFVLIMVLVVLNQSFKAAAGRRRGGDTMIDCIDINKQTAFDNPLLKSHRIQMKPSFIRREEKSGVLLDELQECPLGTVPIPRTLRSSTKHEASEPNGIDQMPPLVRHVPAERVRFAGEKGPCYEMGFRGYIDEYFEFTVSFGGPGGNCG